MLSLAGSPWATLMLLAQSKPNQRADPVNHTQGCVLNMLMCAPLRCCSAPCGLGGWTAELLSPYLAECWLEVGLLCCCVAGHFPLRLAIE
jgi:hypothetical protein